MAILTLGCAMLYANAMPARAPTGSLDREHIRRHPSGPACQER